MTRFLYIASAISRSRGLNRGRLTTSRLIRSSTATVVIVASLAACSDMVSPVNESMVSARLASPLASRQSDVPNQYIVTLRNDVASVADVAGSLPGVKKGVLKHLYKSALKGFTVENLSETDAAAIAKDPRVLRVERDQLVRAAGKPSAAPFPWGLDRIDQRALPLDTKYIAPTDGAGVSVYIIDTGINFTHVDFTGRTRPGVDLYPSDGYGTAADCNGHGTHVAGTVGGTTYGVAKKVTLIPVRVLNCNAGGTMSSVIAGVDWVTANRTLPAVANMSIVTPLSPTLEQALAASVASGVTFTVAAGNDAVDACTNGPSVEPSVIAVGATTNLDSLAWWSNFGPCVDVLAPGENIWSDWIGNNSATQPMNGTSMAAPHVAGAAALYLSLNPSAAPAEVAAALIGNASANSVSGLPVGTPNLLLFTGFMGAPPLQTPPPPAPAPKVAYLCTGLTCTFDGSKFINATGLVWNFGDGTTGTGAVVTHTFGRGNYTVSPTSASLMGQTANSISIKCNPKSCG